MLVLVGLVVEVVRVSREANRNSISNIELVNTRTHHAVDDEWKLGYLVPSSI